MHGRGVERASIADLDALCELYANVYGSLDAPRPFCACVRRPTHQICSKNPWMLSCSYCARVHDLSDALRTTLCERPGTDTSRYASRILDALISFCVSIYGSLDALIGLCASVQGLKCLVLCQRPGLESPRSVQALTLRLQTLVRTFLRQTYVDQDNKRREDGLIECVQMSLRSLLYIGFHEGPLGVKQLPI